jgi:carotenoid cleavage dioxygenase-like enzyme
VRADLSTVGADDFDGKLTTPFTAHPKFDPATGEMMFLGYDFAPPYLRFTRSTPVARWSGRRPSTCPDR